MNNHFKIITITPNPAIDQTVVLDALHLGAVNRAAECHHQAGGKGVNVSARLGEFGIGTIATGFLGHQNQHHFTTLFSQLPIRDSFVRIDGLTRTGIKLVETIGEVTTDINLPGAEVSRSNIDSLHHTLRELDIAGSWCLLGGSLPPGFGLDDFASLIDLLKSAGAQVAVDACGDALRIAVDHKVDLIKPNQHEAAELLGREISDLASAQSAAREIQSAGIPRVILSLGETGSLFLDPCAALIAKAPKTHVASTVGAGDALLAGYLAGLARGMPASSRAQLAIAFAACSLTSISRRLPSPSDLLALMATIEIHPTC